MSHPLVAVLNPIANAILPSCGKENLDRASLLLAENGTKDSAP